MDFWHGETVIVLRGRPVTDAYSRQETGISFDDPIPTTFERCAVGQTSTVERVEAGRTAVVTDLVVVLPYDADVTARDRIKIRGQVHEIVGDPFPVKNPFTGWTPGTEVHVGRVVG